MTITVENCGAAILVVARTIEITNHNDRAILNMIFRVLAPPISRRLVDAPIEAVEENALLDVPGVADLPIVIFEVEFGNDYQDQTL